MHNQLLRPEQGSNSAESSARFCVFLREVYEWQSHCHAIRYRLPANTSIASIQEGFSRVVSELDSQSEGEIAVTELWIEELQDEADSHMAVQRRSFEMSRPVHAQSGWRALLLKYESADSDLILVARRTIMDSASLGSIAQIILSCSGHPLVRDYVPGNQPHGLKSSSKAQTSSPKPPLQTQLDWCVNSSLPGIQQGCIKVPIGNGTTMDNATLIAATGLMDTRYGGAERALIATATRPLGLEPYSIGAAERPISLSISFRDEWESDQIIASVAIALAETVPGARGEFHGTCTHSEEAQASASIGVFLATVNAEFPGPIEPEEYLPVQGTICPITMTLHFDSQSNVELRCNFVGRGFDEAILTQFTRSIARAYVEMLECGGRRLKQIESLSAAEQAQIARIGRSVQEGSVRCETIHGAFAKIASLQWSRPALVMGDAQLSYRELEEYANKVARALIRLGVKNGDRVGVCAERSCELVVVLLAIMKVGASYVPMEPSYPLERLAFIANDSRLRLIVTSRTDFPVGGSFTLVDLPRLIELSAVEESSPVDFISATQGAAYIIYTSGSTGRPKGVAVPHENVFNLVEATKKDLQLSCHDTWTFFHSVAFDFSVWEIWGCLLTGGRLVIVSYFLSRSPLEFLELLKTERVTVLNQTPSAFAQLMEVDRLSPVGPALRLIIFGGETLHSRILLPWLDRHPAKQCRLVNMYGITETTVHVTAQTISREHALNASRSVGRAISGWHLYVVDPGGRLVPPGVAGEICVSGAGVAHGYVGRAGLTAEKFTPDPHSCGLRYRSGDRGRLLPDGRLEHLGRMDSQVKIRGYRIELDEIRAVLLDVENVTAAAVMLHQETPEDAASARLDAYVVMDGGGTDELRRQISHVLPEHMMPSHITVLSSLPLTSNGKLELARLPKPRMMPLPPPESKSVDTQVDDQAGYFRDRLQQIWQNVLRSPIGLDDNFFDVGGNSLYAIRIAAALREEGLPPISLRDIYVHQTVRRIVTAPRV